MRRVLLDHLVVGDVVGRHVRRGTRAASSAGSVRRILHDRRDLVGDRTLVEHVGALQRDLPERHGEVEVLEDRPDLRGVAVRAGRARPSRGTPRTWPCCRGSAARKVWSTVNPFVASRIAGFSDVAERLGAEPVEGGLPGREGARARRPRARRRRHRRTGTRRRTAPCRETLPGITNASLGMSAGAVSRPSIVVTSPLVGVEVHEVPAAADAGAVGLGHAERSRGGDRGIHRVAAVAEHLEADPAGLGVDRGDRAAVPRRGGWRRWQGPPGGDAGDGGRGGIRGRGCGGGDQPGGHDRGERDGRAPERRTAADDVDHDDPRTGVQIAGCPSP